MTNRLTICSEAPRSMSAQRRDRRVPHSIPSSAKVYIRSPSPGEPRGEAGRQQQVIAAARVHHPGPPCGGITRTPEQVAAHRTLDRAAGVLRYHKLPYALGRGEALVRFDPDREAERNVGAVHCQTPLRRQHNPFGTDGTLVPLLAEEYIGGILATQRCPSLGMLVHPIADRRHRYFGTRDYPTLDQQAPDRDIGQPVLAVITDAHGLPVLQPDSARALNLQKKGVDRIVDPQELKTASRQRAIF